MPVCVPDTSCLIHLERIERLDLLQALYDDIRIPPAVRNEYGGVPAGIDRADRRSVRWCGCFVGPWTLGKRK
jgi:predicted nucleic acid-binding protein